MLTSRIIATGLLQRKLWAVQLWNRRYYSDMGTDDNSGAAILAMRISFRESQ